jgi:hypothetical protein
MADAIPMLLWCSEQARAEDARTSVGETPADAIEAQAKRLAAFIRYEWGGLTDRAPIGFPTWAEIGIYQGGRQRLIELAASARADTLEEAAGFVDELVAKFRTDMTSHDPVAQACCDLMVNMTKEIAKSLRALKAEGLSAALPSPKGEHNNKGEA